MNVTDNAPAVVSADDYFYHFDWYLSFWQWGLGISLFPRGEYAIEFIVLCFVITIRWRSGFMERRKSWERGGTKEQG